MITRVIQARKKRGISQKRLAELTGTTQQYISYIEQNKRIPNVILALRIAKALKVKVEEIFIDNVPY